MNVRIVVEMEAILPVGETPDSAYRAVDRLHIETALWPRIAVTHTAVKVMAVEPEPEPTEWR